MHRRVLLAVLLIGWLPTACGQGDGAEVAASSTAEVPTSPPGETATTAAAGGPVVSGSWRTLLEWVPDSPENRSFVIINDYRAARDLLGIGVPDSSSGSGAIAEYLLTLSLGPVSDPASAPPTRSPSMGITDESFGNRAPHDVEAWRSAFGLSVLEVDRSVVAGVPPAQLTVWQGRIDADTVGAAVATDPAWSDELRSVTHAGETYFAWGDDPAMTELDRADPTRPLGRGGCLYAADGLALRTVVCEVLEAALSAGVGSTTALADLEPFAVLAGALEGAGAYAAVLTTDVGMFAVGSMPSLGEGPAASHELLLPYVGAALGVTLDGETSVLVVALIHADGEDAEENGARLGTVVAEGTSSATGRPWSDMLTVADISVDGSLLVARLETDGLGNLWYRMVALRDTLLAWA